MKIIVGLGNPGKCYDKTRHNIGFSVLDYFVYPQKWKNQHHSQVLKIIISNVPVLLIKPQQYMNLSGLEVAHFIKYYKININDILIIHDDMDLDLGKFKIKRDSSSGGHNGLKSIIECVGSQSFCRLKVGISQTRNECDKDFVLGAFSKKESIILAELLPTFKSIMEDFIEFDAEYIMNKYNNLGSSHEIDN